MTLDDIDFATLYRQHLSQSQRRYKAPADWDRRAQKMGSKPLGGPYADSLVARMDLTGSRSVLDVGCGPGTIALLLAPHMHSVVGLDYSPGMLKKLTLNAQRLGLTNVIPLERAWEDDWNDVPVCDIAVASRSGMVPDLAEALAKLNAHARHKVYMTQLVGGHFIDPDLVASVGRQPRSFPDHLYTLGLQHWYSADPERAARGGAPMRWALVNWTPPPPH